MTVKELITLLQTCNGGDLVVLSRDSEGNSFSPLAQVSEDRYTAGRTSWMPGELSLRELTPELIKEGATESEVGDLSKGAKDCITLWPLH